jgi:GxxExxY protein
LGYRAVEGEAMDTQNKFVKTQFDELTYSIIGCAMDSHTQLGPSLRENSYQRDMEIRLTEKNLPYDAQRLYEVMGGINRDHLIGYYIPDLIVCEKVVVELKALAGIGNKHLAQSPYLLAQQLHLYRMRLARWRSFHHTQNRTVQDMGYDEMDRRDFQETQFPRRQNDTSGEQQE